MLLIWGTCSDTLTSFDIRKVTNFNLMFAENSKLTQILVNDSTWSILPEANVEGMFKYCGVSDVTRKTNL